MKIARFVWVWDRLTSFALIVSKLCRWRCCCLTWNELDEFVDVAETEGEEPPPLDDEEKLLARLQTAAAAPAAAEGGSLTSPHTPVADVFRNCEEEEEVVEEEPRKKGGAIFGPSYKIRT